MRMDNETYRLKAENLLSAVKLNENGGYDENIMAQLEKMATTPRKVRHFLKAVSTHPDDSVQEYFYRRVMGRVRSEHDTSDLERHIRHMFYEDREHAKAILGRLHDRNVIAAFLRVISFTEEGWLAGELIRIVLQTPTEELREPIVEALHSEDYLLQCLAIYLIGKSGDSQLLDALVTFYSKPVGQKIDRLESKALDALAEGTKEVEEAQVVRWLKDRAARVRNLALQIAIDQNLAGTAGDIVGLLLIDPRTRTKAAQALLHFIEQQSLRLVPGDSTSEAVRTLIQRAKQDALESTLVALLRDENPGVREVTAYLIAFLKNPKRVTSQLRRIAVEDRVPAVQIAAMKVLGDVDADKLLPVLVDILADAPAASEGAREVVAVATNLMNEALTPEQVSMVERGIKDKEEWRDVAFDRFAGDVEGWRHDL